ncbi:MAG: TRAP transporter large permease, partial [Thermoanaerobacteraceae bacterium]|nr:TRAP transporter large permease [Thermoanaerobacteraceae bacterium]
IPLFIMAGSLMNYGGIGKKLIDVVEKVVGTIKGGLAVVSIVSCAVFGAISGSSSATLTAIGSIMSDKLKENGYPRGFVASLLAASGILGILIPPSMLMILYAWAGNVSVLASFLAAVVPGIMLTVGMSIFAIIYLKNDKNVIVYTKEELSAMKLEEKRIRKENKEFGSLPAVIMPIIVLGGIYSGMLTPTESAGVSVIYAAFIGMFIYKKLNFKLIKSTLVRASVTTGVIMMMMLCMQMLARLFVTYNLPQYILEALMAVSTNKNVILLLINIFMIILGMLMDDTSATLLATPILLPVVTQIGVDPIHFAAILGVNIGMGNITPPTAPLLYLSSSITQTPVKEMLKPTFLLIVFCWLPVLAIVTFFPQTVMWLPRLVLGY